MTLLGYLINFFLLNFKQKLLMTPHLRRQFGWHLKVQSLSYENRTDTRKFSFIRKTSFETKYCRRFVYERILHLIKTCFKTMPVSCKILVPHSWAMDIFLHSYIKLYLNKIWLASDDKSGVRIELRYTFSFL